MSSNCLFFSGSHVNDDMNQPDKEGRVLVNVGHPPAEPDIHLAPQLGEAVKPHQVNLLILYSRVNLCLGQIIEQMCSSLHRK